MRRPTRDPSAHDAHEAPLANRLVEGELSKWLAGAFATVRAGDLDEGALQALQELESLHLSGIGYDIVPRILDALRRAGLLNG